MLSTIIYKKTKKNSLKLVTQSTLLLEHFCQKQERVLEM